MSIPDYARIFAKQWIETTTKEQNQMLELQAESNTLPEYLMIESIAYLLGRVPHVFRQFIEDQPVKIEMTLGVPCISRDNFKAYRQSINQWPVKDSLLANWWIDQETIQESKPELNKFEIESMLKLIIGMAIDSYGYDPTTEKRQKATGEKAGSISAGLASRGIIIDNGTIKKYLDEAKRKQLHIPPAQ